LLHPYLSLHLLHLLTDVSVRGFVIGATNALFRQKTHLVDVVVEVSFPSVEFFSHSASKKHRVYQKYQLRVLCLLKSH